MMQVSSAVIMNDKNEILLLKRTKHKKQYPGKWNVMSGTIEGEESPLHCLEREVKEELGLSNFQIIKKMHFYFDIQNEGKWKVFPFLCKTKDKIILDKKEHSKYKWILLNQIKKYDLVPGAIDDLKVLKLIK